MGRHHPGIDLPSDQRTTQVARDAHQLRSGTPQPAQRVEADGIGREQIRQVDPDVADGGVADAPQLGHVRRVQVPGEMNGAAIGPWFDLDATLHERGLRQDRHQTDETMSTPCLCAGFTEPALTRSQDVVALTGRGKSRRAARAPGLSVIVEA
jgi:hypothetical protein